MRAHPLSTTDIDALLHSCGEGLSSCLIEIAEIRSPVTHSALVIFEDSLQDDRKVEEIIEHIRQLHDGFGDAVPVRTAQFLDELMYRLDPLPSEHSAAMFRSGFFQNRRVVPA